MNSYLAMAASYGRRHLDLLGLAVVLLAALALRLIELGTVPGNLTADESDDLQNVYRVLAGKAGGFFGLDWNQAPNLNMYLKAAAVAVFGDTVAGSRMYSVVLSLIALAVFYPLARRRLEPLPSLIALLLLATSLWFLHFSRTPWVAMSAVLAAVLAAYILDLAIEKKRLWLFALLGAAVAFGAYGYFAGRTLVFVIIACYAIAVLFRRQDFWPLTQGFVLSGAIAFLLFAPQLKTQLENWDYANTRPRTVSVFTIEGQYLGDTGTSNILRHQVLRTVQGFILLDNSVAHNGLWARQRPIGWTFVDRATAVIYWVGLVAGLVYWRRYVYWWAFLLIPLFITQVFSTGTPDGSRALIVAPFMFLFVGLGLQTIIGLFRRPMGRQVVSASLVSIALVIAVYNVEHYFEWMDQPYALAVRQPAVELEDFVYWKRLAREYANRGALLPTDAWQQYRRDVLGRPGP